MDYGFSKKNEFSENLENNKNVLFIDFGHSKMNTFVTAFNKQHMRILANKFNRQLGCKFMDEELLKFYAKIFDEAHPNL
jgi:molecular chaperone DnaK (HSP70)